MKKSNPGFRLQIAVSVVAMLAVLAQAQAEPVVPPAKSIKAEETAILLVDFQANFVSPDGAWYQKFAQHYAKTRMLERTVELVGKARAKGVLIVHITEGYTSDYRELDPANPGGFHRGQIGREVIAQRHVFGDRGVEQMCHLFHDRVDIQPLYHKAPLPGIGEHLAGEIRGAARGGLNLCNRRAGGRFRRQIEQRQVGVAEDGDQQIVEIMGDASGEHAQTL